MKLFMFTIALFQDSDQMLCTFSVLVTSRCRKALNLGQSGPKYYPNNLKHTRPHGHGHFLSLTESSQAKVIAQLRNPQRCSKDHQIPEAHGYVDFASESWTRENNACRYRKCCLLRSVSPKHFYLQSNICTKPLVLQTAICLTIFGQCSGLDVMLYQWELCTRNCCSDLVHTACSMDRRSSPHGRSNEDIRSLPQGKQYIIQIIVINNPNPFDHAGTVQPNWRLMIHYAQRNH
eukprot:439376-Amphidinium_carterae.1